MNDEWLGAINISFLRGHAAELRQSISQLSLKPEEVEKS